MALGVQLPEAERQVTWPEYVAMARTVEEIGLDSVWVGDHLLYRADTDGPQRGPLEAWSLAAGLACTAFHPPGVLARMAATVDEISGGRLTLGLGAGWNEPEFGAFGLAWDHPASRFEEAFSIIRRLLSGERVTHVGRFYRTADAVVLPRPARSPRLMVGSLGRRVLSAALPWVDAWNAWGPWCGNTPEGFAAANARVSDLAVGLGRYPDTIDRSVCVYTELAPAPGEVAFREDAPPLTGSPAAIAAGIRAFGEAGADEVIMVLNVVTERSIRSLGAVLELLDADPGG
jgi:alkanesulfonate monooxygenase SsuD/methylene tetrahydromethanopterin reductase-like flavin-dependent oxidoreductase (luciferase family)